MQNKIHPLSRFLFFTFVLDSVRKHFKLFRIIFCLISFSILYGAEEVALDDVFSEIYEVKYWGENSEGDGYSGPGSLLEQTVEYRHFLQKFLADYAIDSVVDVGCGDWSFSKAIEWGKIDYYGFDVVASVIEKNIHLYGSPNVRFFVADGKGTNYLPLADLVICKDVLQHLSHEKIQELLDNFDKYKYCLITNDVGDVAGHRAANIDITSGGHRFLDLTSPPFSLDAEVVLSYVAGFSIKEVLLIKPPITRRAGCDATLADLAGEEGLHHYPQFWNKAIQANISSIILQPLLEGQI